MNSAPTKSSGLFGVPPNFGAGAGAGVAAAAGCVAYEGCGSGSGLRYRCCAAGEGVLAGTYPAWYLGAEYALVEGSGLDVDAEAEAEADGLPVLDPAARL